MFLIPSPAPQTFICFLFPLYLSSMCVCSLYWLCFKTLSISSTHSSPFPFCPESWWGEEKVRKVLQLSLLPSELQKLQRQHFVLPTYSTLCTTHINIRVRIHSHQRSHHLRKCREALISDIPLHMGLWDGKKSSSLIRTEENFVIKERERGVSPTYMYLHGSHSQPPLSS